MFRNLMLALLVGVLVTGLASARENDSVENPNVVIILVDDMGYGDPGCFNADSKIPTPHIDRLASEGMRFTDAHAPGPLCHVSRYGLLTGTYPFRTKVGVWGRQAVIGEDQLTIASLLKESGYRTEMVGKWHLGFDENGYENPLTGGPVDRGFDSFFGIRASTDIPPYFYIRDRQAVEVPSEPIEARATEGWSPIQGEFWRAGLIAPDMKLEDVLPRFTEEAVRVITDHADSETQKPLMLYLAYPAPHTPWLPAPEFSGKSGAGMYGDFVMHVDAMIGRVMDALDAANMADNTMVVLSSDNGPVWYPRDVERFEHDSSGGLRGMKADAWEAGHRMPLIVRWPGTVESGSVSDQLFCFTDFLATLAAVVGARLPEGAGIDSFNFLPVLQGTQSDDQPVRPGLVMASGNGTMTIRSGDWKLIEGLGSGGFTKPGRIKPAAGQPSGQLFDLRSDPGESRNLYDAYPKRVAEMTRQLRHIQKNGHAPSTQAVVSKNGKRPNIVLVMADDQGWGQTGYYGHPNLKTPNLDAMAANGLRMDRFYAAAPVCSPTRASVLTGRTNRRTGVESHGYALRRQETSIATILRDSGYSTGHFGKWHLNGLRGPGVPVLSNDTHHPGVFGFENWLSVTNFFDVNPVMSRNGEFVELKGDSSEVIVREAIEFVRQQVEDDQPFFTVIWYGTPHSPFIPLESDAQTFSDLERRTRNQLGELVAMDRSLGTLREALREMGVADNTLVWFSSDNGGLPKMDPDTVGGLRGHKRSLYEGGIRVPTIIEWPAVIEPRISSYPAVSMDMFATITDIIGESDNKAILPHDGISLQPLFTRDMTIRDQPIPFSCFGDMAVIDNQYKLLRLKGKDQPARFELYDLATDAGERTDLLESLPGVARRMKSILEDYDHSIQQSISGADYPEKSVNDGEPQPRSWRDDPRYEPYLDQWKDRPEYRSTLKNR